MKIKISGIVAFLVVLFLCTSGLFEAISDFFVWLVTLNATQSSISIAGGIFVKMASFIISYLAVGFLFNLLGFFDRNLMKVAYFIISTLVSFILCYIIMILETYLLPISIVVAVLLVLAIAANVTVWLVKRKKTKAQTEEQTEV